MLESSTITVRRADARPAKAKSKIERAAPPIEGAPTLASVAGAGVRKLVRPRLPAGTLASRYAGRVSTMPPLLTTRTRADSGAAQESSHAEAFYFQKQIQSQTLMIFVLEDGQQIEGYIEWYDRDCIKIRHGVRTLIYKSSIKYLYKAGEQGLVNGQL